MLLAIRTEIPRYRSAVVVTTAGPCRGSRPTIRARARRFYDNGSIGASRLGFQSARRRAGARVLAFLAAAATVAAVVAIAAGLLGGNDGNAGSIIDHARILGSDPLAFDPSRSAAYERAAAFGLSHVLFAKSPGGVARTAKRTARFRPLVEKAVAGTGLDPGTVEAMIFLESAGRPEAIAGSDPAAAAGLTQILAETARNLLGMPVNLSASRRLTRKIGAAEARGDTAAVERLQARRRKVDARFDPAQAIAGAVRYLKLAEGRFGSSSLAVVSYHMGIGNLEGILRAYARLAGQRGTSPRSSLSATSPGLGCISTPPRPVTEMHG